MQVLIALLLGVHAIAHLPGFIVDWRLSTFETLPYRTTILWGAFDVGEAGIRLIGALWLVSAAAFFVCAVGAGFRAEWWGWLAFGAATLSLALSVTALPETRVGVVVDAVMLFALVTYQLGGISSHAS